jgi:hypothetical protein
LQLAFTGTGRLLLQPSEGATGSPAAETDGVARAIDNLVAGR